MFIKMLLDFSFAFHNITQNTLHISSSISTGMSKMTAELIKGNFS